MFIKCTEVERRGGEIQDIKDVIIIYTVLSRIISCSRNYKAKNI